ncbi:hypothetical protein [Methylobacterium sp. Leaf118]|uniref:hypothetical protein n=1 Tax=Methylobacterium sp. Leaf118 TaxID=2876562 RepID=UPI001E4216F6|nr:hypothetical protein [Methylobacterium sp. Leaf118]
MGKPTNDDDQAVERLTLYMLKETYCAAAAALMRMNPAASGDLFRAFERQIADALDRMHVSRSEGPDSTAIAVAVGTRIADILDQAHRRQFEPGGPGPAVKAEASPGLPAPREAESPQDAAEILAELHRRWSATS